MAEDTHSPLLQRPRELRGSIYSQVGGKREFAQGNTKQPQHDKSPRLGLNGSLNLSLLLTCRKIYDEYKEAWSKHPKELGVLFPCKDDLHLTLDNLPFPTSFPINTLRSVNRCTITLPLVSLMAALDSITVDCFTTMIKSMSPAVLPSLKWTPSSGMTHCLRSLIHQMFRFVSPRASVDLRIIYHDAEDLEMLVDEYIIQPSVFNAFESDDDLSCAQAGKLKLRFILATAVCCDIIEAGADAVPGLPSASVEEVIRTRADGTTYRTKESADGAMWTLKPLPEQQRSIDSSFCGFALTRGTALGE